MAFELATSAFALRSKAKGLLKFISFATCFSSAGFSRAFLVVSLTEPEIFCVLCTSFSTASPLIVPPTNAGKAAILTSSSSFSELILAMSLPPFSTASTLPPNPSILTSKFFSSPAVAMTLPFALNAPLSFCLITGSNLARSSTMSLTSLLRVFEFRS